MANEITDITDINITLFNSFLSSFNSFISLASNSHTLNTVNALKINKPNNTTTSNTLVTNSHQSTTINPTNPLTNLTTAAANIIDLPIQQVGVILDSGCSDTSYRTCDTSNIIPVHIEDQLRITTASGDELSSYGSSSRNFCNDIHHIDVFEDSKLTFGMHSASQFTNDPYNNTVILNKYGFKVVNPDNKIICENSKLPSDKIWLMPSISPTPNSPCSSPFRCPTANLFIKHEPNAVFVSYMSACSFSPPDSTLEKAVRKGWLRNLPRLTGNMVASNKPHSIASSLGHLNSLRQNLRSTSPAPTSIPTTADNDIEESDEEDDDYENNESESDSESDDEEYDDEEIILEDDVDEDELLVIHDDITLHYIRLQKN